MLIRKKYKFRGMHIVRDCSSERCKKSIHSHTYTVEIKLTASALDNGQMIVDFGLLKGTIKDIIDSFNNAYSLWCRESDKFQEFIKIHNARYVVLPFSPTAEMYSVMFFTLVHEIITNTQFNNGETNVKLYSVRVHETDTGWAEAFEEDYNNFWFAKYSIADIIFSDSIKHSWKDAQMWDKILSPSTSKKFINPIIELHYAKK